MLAKYTTALLALAGLVSAVPAKQPRILQFDDVILPRADGGFDVMKDWEWEDVERRMARRAEEAIAMEHKRRALAGETVPQGAVTSGLSRRGCEESEELQVISDTSFTDWDVAMSPVLGATGGSATVMVSKGYSVASSLAITASEDVSVPDILKVSLSITATETWTTTDTQTFSFAVPLGQYGVVISNPLTRRVTGNFLSGCTDSPTTTPFTSDSRTNQTFGELSWVAGPIKMCNSTSYPIPYCIGDGSHA